MRAARIAGKSLPESPIPVAKATAIDSKPGATRKAKVTWLKVC